VIQKFGKKKKENVANIFPERRFRVGSEIKVSFILHTKLHEDATHYGGWFFVQSENSIFELLLELLELRRNPCKIFPESKNLYWGAINISDRLYEPWDIFRIRTALDTMLLETAEDAFGGGHTDICGENLFTRRDFALCDHPNKLPRKLVIEMTCLRDDIVICRDQERN